MTTLITIAIVLLFGLCVYIESNYAYHKQMAIHVNINLYTLCLNNGI